MKPLIVAVLVLTPVLAQPGIPIFIGPTINFLPPAVDATAATVAFGSSVSQSGVENTIDLYVGSTKLLPNVTSVGLTRDGKRAIFADMVNGGESVGTFDLASGTAKRLTVDTQGCIRPLALCVSCFFACVATPHATADGAKVLYTVRRSQPFFTINADGTGLAQLPVYSGVLAPSPQRVISANGRVVFTSAAPFGPTFAAAPTDVYAMNVDGTNIKNLTNFGNNASIFASNANVSADASTIVFETNFAGAGAAPANGTQIWMVHSDGSGLQQLTFPPGSATSPSISGDGKTLVCIQAGRLNVLPTLPTLQPPGPKIVIAPFRYSVVSSPVISEDGLHIVFLIGPPDSTNAGAVYEVNTDGSGLHAVYAPRAISPRGVVSAAGFAMPPSSGGLVSVYGLNFSGDSVINATGFPLPIALTGTSLFANGKALPLLNISPWQITAQVPQETAAAQSVKFQAAFIDQTTTPIETADIAAASPAIFASQIQHDGASFYQAAAFHAGTSIAADDDHPAKAGEILEMYGTGVGLTDPMVPGGQPSPGNPVAKTRTEPRVFIGTVPARVLFVGLTPGLAGVGQINITVPDGLRPGRYGVVLQIDNANPGAVGSIAIQ